MAKNTRWPLKAFQDKGLIERNGVFVPISRVTSFGPVKKIEPSLATFEKPSENKKILNATKSIIDGIKFDSLLEAYLYGLLKSADIYFEFQKEYILQDKFKYRNESIRKISLTVDFFLPIEGIIADSKGLQTQQGAIRWKLLKSVLKHLNGEEPEIVMLKNKKECECFVNRLLYQP